MVSKTCVIENNRGQRVRRLSGEALFSLCFWCVNSETETKRRNPFLIPNIRRVFNAIFFLLGDIPASEFCAEVYEQCIPFQ